jgi:hypothetical protein
VPRLEDVRSVLDRPDAWDQANPADLVCFGEAKVPGVGELSFEPYIVTPTESFWRQLHWVVIAMALLVLYALDGMSVLPSWIPSPRVLTGGFAYFLAAGAFVAGLWVWRALIRPSYIRMAPGIIQVLKYRAGGKPTIHAFPMTAGTLAVVTRIRKRFILTLSRGGVEWTLDISRLREPQQWIERTWQALLSTAPTPPLSDEELVG